MKTIRKLLPLLIGIALTCGLLILLQPQATRALIITLTQTTLEDFNQGSFYRTGMTRLGDGEVTLLRRGIAGQWITTTNAAGLVPRFAHASIVYNNRIYVFGGLATGESALRSIQSALINTANHNLTNWVTSSVTLSTNIYTDTTTGAGVSGLAAVELNGYVYLLGGSAVNYLGTNHHYNVVAFSKIGAGGTLGPLATTKPLPQARSYGQAVVLNGRIYYIGGTSTGVTFGFPTVYYATPNPTTGAITAWFTTTAPLPYAPFGETAVADEDTNRIYVVAGYTLGSGVVPNVYYADPATATGNIAAWSSTTPLPRNLYGSAAVLFGGQIYDTGGAIDDLSSASDSAFAAFDEPGGGVVTWTETSVITPARLLHTGIVNSDGWIYLVGGSSDGLTPITQHMVNAGATTGQSGSAYASSGTFRSPDFDIVKNYQMQTLAWTTYLSDPKVVTLTMRYRTRPSSGGYSNWSVFYPSLPVAGVAKTTIPLSVTARYLQYEAYFATNNPITTPILSQVELTYNRPNPPQFVKSAIPSNGSNVQPGQRITYTIRFTNTTGTTLLNVTISDTVPVTATYVANSIAATPGITRHAEFLPNLYWEVGTLPISATGQVGFVVTVNSNCHEGDAVRNTAFLDSDTIYAISQAVHPCGTPPKLSKSHVSSAPLAAGNRVQPGDLVTFTLTYNNPPASAALNGAIISDTLPAQVDYIPNSGSPAPDLSLLASQRLIRWPVGSVPSGGGGSVRFTVRVKGTSQVPDGVTIVNSASLGSVGRITVKSNDDTLPVRYRFDLRLSKTTNVTKSPPGTNITYTIRITNVAELPITANGIEVLDYLQPGLPGLTRTNVINCVAPCAGWNFVEIDPQGERVYSRIIPQLGPNQSTVVTMVVHISNTLWTTAPEVLAVSNTAEANADDTAGIEIRPTNQRDQEITTVAGPDIEVAKLIAPAKVNPGKTFTARVTLFNNGFTPTKGPDNTGWFGVDLYIKPAGSPPPSGPYDRYLGACGTLDNPCPSSFRGAQYSVVGYTPPNPLDPSETITATFLPSVTQPGIYWLYVQADTFWDDTPSIFGTAAHGRVIEGNEINNIYGPFVVDVSLNKVYLPLIRKNS